MAIDFPNSPSNNDQYTVGTTTWMYNGTAWVVSLGDASIATGAITADKIASNAVTTAKILDANVTAGKIASGAAVSNIGYTPANVAGPTFTGTVVLPSTTSIGTVSATEIGYVDGVTSAIQTQLNSKLTTTTAVTSNRNVIINGDFKIWQRGTSFANCAFGLTADRWEAGRGAFATGLTVSRQLGPDNFIYSARVQRVSGNTSTQNIRFATTLETINSIPLANKTVTLSFYARCGANFSTSSNQIEVYLRSGTASDAGRIGAGDTFGTGAATPLSLIQPLTTSWQRFSVSGTIGATANQLALIVYASPTGTAGANDWYEISGVQLELGSVVTPFEFEDYGITMQKCQRYFQIAAQLTAYTNTSTACTVWGQLNSPMRTGPTASANGPLNIQGDAVINTTQSSVNITNNYSTAFAIYLTGVGNFTGLVTGRTITIGVPVNNGNYFTFDAEL